MRTKIAMFEKQSNLQVANYMNGGHYNPHHDYVMKEKNPEHVSCDLINLIFPTPDWLWLQVIYNQLLS